MMRRQYHWACCSTYRLRGIARKAQENQCKNSASKIRGASGKNLGNGQKLRKDLEMGWGTRHQLNQWKNLGKIRKSFIPQAFYRFF